MNRERMRTIALVAATLATAAPGMAQAQAQAQTQARPQTRPAASSTGAARAVSDAIEATASVAGAAVVEIFTMSYAPTEGRVAGTTDLVRTQRASGSGAIVDPTGYIVTNAHVVRGAQRIRVQVPTVPGGSILTARGRMLDGTVVGLDVETDLAVVKVEATGLPTLAFGDSDELRAGQLVVALGSPLGFYNSVSLGVVSAVARQLEPESPMVYIQSDASISSGSSGGPLVDLQGRIVGINTLVAAAPEGAAGAGPGFAAPSNIVRSVYQQIRANGYVRRGDIGVRPQTVTPVLATGLGLARDYGVILADVLPGGPAAQAGLRPGDVVVALDGKAMENGRQLQVGLYRRNIGDVVALDILRDGQPQSLRVTMAGRRDSLADLSAGGDPRDHVVARLGVLGVDLNATIAKMLPPLRIVAGVLVVSVTPGILDTRDGELRAGDVIHVVNRAPVAGMADLRTALAAVKTGDSVVLHIERNGELVYVTYVAD